jgi:hypothetical protein
MVVFHSFKRYLLEYLLFWVYLGSIPFAAWILLLVICADHKDVDIELLSLFLSLAVGSSTLPESLCC